jgi:PKMT, C-terminal winged helix domain
MALPLPDSEFLGTLARLQARSGLVVANLRHASVRLEDELGRQLRTLLDGERDRVALSVLASSVEGDSGR